MITLTRLVGTAAFVITIACAGCSKSQLRVQPDAAPHLPARQREVKQPCGFSISRS